MVTASTICLGYKLFSQLINRSSCCKPIGDFLINHYRDIVVSVNHDILSIVQPLLLTPDRMRIYTIFKGIETNSVPIEVFVSCTLTRLQEHDWLNVT